MDIALFYDEANLAFDWQLVGGDLVVDDGLYTPLALSICSDRLANSDDAIPDGSGDRRGTWMDTQAGDAPDGPPDFAGTRLWLLGRAKQTRANLALGVQYLEEALAWMIADGVASSVTVTGTYPSLGVGIWSVAIAERNADGTQTTHNYDVLWRATLGVAPPVLRGKFATPLPAFGIGTGGIGRNPIG